MGIPFDYLDIIRSGDTNEVDDRHQSLLKLERDESPKTLCALLFALTDSDNEIQHKAKDMFLSKRSIKNVEIIFKILNNVQSESTIESNDTEILSLTKDHILSNREVFETVIINQIKLVSSLYPEKEKQLTQCINSSGRSILPILTRLLNDEDKYVRRNCVRLIGEIGGPETITPLINLLSDKDKKVKKIVVKYLKDMKEQSIITQLIENIPNYDKYTKIDIINIVIKSGTIAVPLLIDFLSTNDEEVRNSCFKALVKIGFDSTPYLNESLSTIKDDKIWLIIDIIEKIGDPASISPLIEMLTSNEDNLRSKIIEALGNIGDKRALKPLSKLLRNKNINERTIVTNAIMKIDNAYLESIEPIIPVNVTCNSVLKNRQLKTNPTHNQEITSKLSNNTKSQILDLEKKIMHYIDIFKNLNKTSLMKSKEKITPPLEHMLDPIIETLFKSKNINTRRECTRILGNYKGAKVEIALRQALFDPNWNVRYCSVNSLKKIGSHNALETLKIAENDTSFKVKELVRSIINTEQQIKTIKSLHVKEPLKISKPKISYKTINTKENNEIEAIKKALNDENWMTRCRIIESLSNNKHPKIVDIIIHQLNDHECEVRKAAVNYLKHIDDKKVINVLIYTLKNDVLNVTKAASNALIHKGQMALEQLIIEFHNGDDITKIKIAEILGEIGDQNAIKTLEKHQNHNNHTVKRKINNALVKIKSIHTNSFTKEKIKQSNTGPFYSPTIKFNIVKVENAIYSLSDDDYRIRRKAIDYLGDVRENRAVLSLCNKLQDTHPHVRSKAALALGKIADTRAIPYLLEAKKDPDNNVRWRVRIALEKLHLREKMIRGNENTSHLQKEDEAIRNLSKEDSNARVSAAMTLGDYGSSACVPALIETLKDTNASVRMNTVIALGKLRDPRALGPLTERMLNDSWIIIREYAQEAINTIQVLS